jgi:hypothetical protein
MPDQTAPKPSLATGIADEAHHADNQRRFIAIEQKLDANTVLTEALAGDTAELVAMWRDASVVFKWFRKLGAVLMWISKVVLAIGALYGAGRYWGSK